MPVYLRKNMNMSPPKGEPADLADDDDFVKDPDQVKDSLPQPFRLIDKLVTSIVDEAWEVVSVREHEKIKEASRLRPPKYECGIHLDLDSDDVSAMVDSKDGRYIIMGMTNGLTVIDAHTHHIVAHWKQDGIEITAIQVSILSDQIHLLATVDDLGTARLFSLAGEAIYLMHVMNEQGEAAKVNAGKCECSPEGDYVGVYLESQNIAECALEIHKLPKDVWVKELENLVAKAAAKKEAANLPPSSPAPGEAGVELTHPSEGPTTKDSGAVEEDSRSQSPGSQKGDTQSHKFSAPTITMKVKAPTALSGGVHTSTSQAAKSVDSTGEVIGHGTTHLLTTSHLEQRKAMFDQLHSEYLKYIPSDPKPSLLEPTFHFLQPNRPLPHGLEQQNMSGIPTIVSVWWTGHAHVLHYSLAKQAKELEHKADQVWPLSSSVVCSTTSPCTSLVAVGLQNNNIVVWDAHLGMPRRVTHITDKGKILKLDFVDPSISPQMGEDTPYTLRTACYLLVTSTDGQLFYVDVGMGSTSPVEEVSLQITKDTELPSLVMLIHGVPELILTCRQNGTVFIHDLLKGSQLCEVTLPKSHSLTTPWKPVVAVGAGGQMLYLKGCAIEGSVETTADENDNNPESTKVFGFAIRSFPALDKYRLCERPDVSFYVHTTAEKRVDALMRERISNQGLRQSRMQQRWSQMKNELKTIQNLRDTAKSKPKSAYAESSIAVTPLLIGGRLH